MHHKTAQNTHIIIQIEALLKRINDENKKTKEVLEKIDRGEFKKEKRVSDQCDQMSFANSLLHIKVGEVLPYLGKRKEEAEEEGEDGAAGTAENSSKSRVSFSGSWATDKAEDITWATSMEQKRWTSGSCIRIRTRQGIYGQI